MIGQQIEKIDDKGKVHFPMQYMDLAISQMALLKLVKKIFTIVAYLSIIIFYLEISTLDRLNHELQSLLSHKHLFHIQIFF